MAIQTVPETLEWLRFAATIITPFAVLWIGIAAANRKKLMQEIHEQLNDMRRDIADSRRECREDTKALMQQFAEYPRRDEMMTAIRNVSESFHHGAGRR